MAMAKMWARAAVLVFLIAALVAGAAIWFDIIGVIDIKTTLAPLYRIPFIARLTGVQARSQDPIAPGEFLSLEAERLAVRLESYELQQSELNEKETALKERETQLNEIAAELEARQKTIDEQQRTIEEESAAASSRDRIIEQQARWLTNQPPANAVAQIVEMTDQDAIEVLRKVEAIAQAEGAASLVSVWLQLMPPARSAELLRKMALQP